MSSFQDPIELTGGGGRNLDIVRAFVVFLALVAIAVGVVSLTSIGATLRVIAFLFGVFLIVIAIYRVAIAFLNRRASAGGFVFNILVAAVLVGTGIVCLNSSAQSLAILAAVIGIAWIFEGVADLAAAGRGYTSGRRGLVALSGIFSILAGIAMLFLPGLSLAIFAEIGAILLIVVGLTTLLTLPRRSARTL
jgi:uncharacterized membrane protein HdeD (DUF308 family)